MGKSRKTSRIFQPKCACVCACARGLSFQKSFLQYTPSKLSEFSKNYDFAGLNYTWNIHCAK